MPGKLSNNYVSVNDHKGMIRQIHVLTHALIFPVLITHEITYYKHAAA